MKIYFKESNKQIEYSLDEFEFDIETNYFDFEIPEFYSEEEAESLCELAISSYINQKIPFDRTINQDIENKRKFMESLKENKTFICINSKIKSIHLSVYLVYRGNFNDERLIETRTLNISEIIDKEIEWLDLYLDKNSNNSSKIAFVHLNQNNLYYLINKDGKITSYRYNVFSNCYSDDYDEKYIISSNIHCSL